MNNVYYFLAASSNELLHKLYAEDLHVILIIVICDGVLIHFQKIVHLIKMTFR